VTDHFLRGGIISCEDCYFDTEQTRTEHSIGMMQVSSGIVEKKKVLEGKPTLVRRVSDMLKGKQTRHLLSSYPLDLYGLLYVAVVRDTTARIID